MPNPTQHEELADEVAGIRARLRSLEAMSGTDRGPSLADMDDLRKRLDRLGIGTNLNHTAIEEIQSVLREIKANKLLPTTQLIEVIGGPIAEKLNEVSARSERNLEALRSTMGSVVADAERAAKAGAMAAEKSVTDFATNFAYGDDR